MNRKIYKNEYQWVKDLRDSLKNHPVAKLLRPLKRYLPEPRDFLLRQAKGGVICEIGVWDGQFSQRIMQVAKPKELYLIDPWQAELWTDPKGVGGGKYTQEAQDQRYQRVLDMFEFDVHVDVIRDTSDNAVDSFNDEYFDLVYIDGDHSYEQVKRDLENWWPKVKKGGILCGDDYYTSGVKKAVYEFARSFCDRPIMREKLVIKNWQFVIKKHA